MGKDGSSVIDLAIAELRYEPDSEDIFKFVTAVLKKSEPSSPLLSSALHRAANYIDIAPAVGRIAKMLLEHGVPVTADILSSWIEQNGRKDSPAARINMDTFFKNLPNPYAYFGDETILDMINSARMPHGPKGPEIFYSEQAMKAMRASLAEARKDKKGRLHTTEIVLDRGGNSAAVVTAYDDEWDEVTAMTRGADNLFRCKIEHTLSTPKDFQIINGGRWMTCPDYLVVDDEHGEKNRLW